MRELSLANERHFSPSQTSSLSPSHSLLLNLSSSCCQLAVFLSFPPNYLFSFFTFSFFLPYRLLLILSLSLLLSLNINFLHILSHTPFFFPLSRFSFIITLSFSVSFTHTQFFSLSLSCTIYFSLPLLYCISLSFSHALFLSQFDLLTL